MYLVPGLGVSISYGEAEDLDLLSVLGTSNPGGRPGKKWYNRGCCSVGIWDCVLVCLVWMVEVCISAGRVCAVVARSMFRVKNEVILDCLSLSLSRAALARLTLISHRRRWDGRPCSILSMFPWQ
jgi:hypothetical protein